MARFYEAQEAKKAEEILIKYDYSRSIYIITNIVGHLCKDSEFRVARAKRAHLIAFDY